MFYKILVKPNAKKDHVFILKSLKALIAENDDFYLFAFPSIPALFVNYKDEWIECNYTVQELVALFNENFGVVN